MKPPAITDVCDRCMLAFLSANDADRHWKSNAHRFFNIDRAIRRLGWPFGCPGPCFPATGRSLID